MTESCEQKPRGKKKKIVVSRCSEERERNVKHTIVDTNSVKAVFNERAERKALTKIDEDCRI